MFLSRETLKIILLVLSAFRKVVQDEAANNIAKPQARQKADYERQHKKQLHFKVGQKVFLYNLKRTVRKSDKGEFLFSGP